MHVETSLVYRILHPAALESIGVIRRIERLSYDGPLAWFKCEYPESEETAFIGGVVNVSVVTGPCCVGRPIGWTEDN